jgi:N6-adenosine-specific RNA methylase IME4
MSKINRSVITDHSQHTAAEDLLQLGAGRFRTVLADPPWRFQNRTGKMAPEHRRLSRYGTMALDEIMELPVAQVVQDRAHLYLWVPNALVLEGLEVMRRWGFTYKTNLIWYKTRKDGGPDGRGVGFYFRNVTEMLLFGVRGKNNRTLGPGRTQTNIIATRKASMPSSLARRLSEPSQVRGLEEQASIGRAISLVEPNRAVRVWRERLSRATLVQRSIPGMEHRAGHELIRREQVRQHLVRRAVVIREKANQEMLVELIRGSRVEHRHFVDALAV